MTNEKEFGLEAYFEAGRAAAVAPSAELMDRIMQDAETEMQVPAIVTPKAPSLRLGPLASLMDAIGGWPVLAGMATAGVVGVWIGFSQPVGLDLLAQQMLGVEDADYLVDLVPAFENGFEEG